MFFERPDSGELAVLVHLDLASEKEPEDPREFEELALSAGGDPVSFITGHRNAPHPKYFVGTGKVDELRQAVEETPLGWSFSTITCHPARNATWNMNSSVGCLTGPV